jgi:serine/threonine-protein kinase SRK2
MGACASCARAWSPDADLAEAYTLLKRVGSGGEGTVWLAEPRDAQGGKNTVPSHKYALKLVHRGQPAWQVAAIAREVQCSLWLGATHVNIVRPHELLLTPRHVVLVTQYERGGTLASYCAAHKVSETTACYFFRQFVAALAHCHAQQIAFRDVKLDNMLLDDAQPPTLRLCDFGVARRWGAEEPANKNSKRAMGRMNTLAGTPGFLSPQVLGVLFAPRGGSGYDGAAADVWSAGVVLAVMLLHRLPFAFADVAASLDGPAMMRVAWEAELRTRWRAADAKRAAALDLSADALDLLDRMLEPDEAKRITLAEVCAHPWHNQALPEPMAAALAAQAAAQARNAGCAAECELHATDDAIAEIVGRAASLGGAGPEGRCRGIEARLSLVPEACRVRSFCAASSGRVCSSAAEAVAQASASGASASGAAVDAAAAMAAQVAADAAAE